jgi:Kef-type K+ transport system membrane component KefB
VLTGVLAVRSSGRGWPLLERALHTSSQLPVRFAVLLVFGLVALAVELGLDLLLGGFVAGLITRQALRGREVQIFESKVTAIGYGFLIPFFFVYSGMNLDVESLFSSVGTFLEVPMFLALFLIVRGVPALLLYRRDLDGSARNALAFFSSTQLPLVVAITTLAVESGNMRAATAASLVGAAALSTLIFPLIALSIRRRSPEPAQALV